MIAIIAILAAIATFETRSLQARYAVEGGTKTLNTDLLQARIRATQRNRIHWVKFDATAYTITEDTNPAPDGDEKLDAADAVLTAQRLNANFPLVWVGASNPIQINTKGLIVTSETGSAIGTARFNIPISDSGEYDCIIVYEVRTAMGKWNGANCVTK